MKGFAMRIRTAMTGPGRAGAREPSTKGASANFGVVQWFVEIMVFSRVTHDDAALVAHGNLVGHESGLEVVEAEPALRSVVTPVAVVVAVTTAAARLVTDLIDNASKTMRKLKAIGFDGGQKPATERKFEFWRWV